MYPQYCYDGSKAYGRTFVNWERLMQNLGCIRTCFCLCFLFKFVLIYKHLGALRKRIDVVAFIAGYYSSGPSGQYFSGIFLGQSVPPNPKRK